MLFLFFFLVIFNNFFIIPVDREKIKVKLVLAIPTGALAAAVNDIIVTFAAGALKTIKILSMWSKEAMYLLNFLLHDFLRWIYSIK